MSILSNKVRAKYPNAYNDMSDQELEKRVLSKHPQYSDLVGNKPEKKTVGGFVGNIFKSGGNLVKDLTHTVTHPSDTIRGLATMYVGGVDKFLPGVSREEKQVNALGREYDKKYGFTDVAKGDFNKAKEKTWNTFYNDPTGTMMDASVVLGGASSALKGAGAVSKASGLTRAGELLGTAGELADPLRMVGRGAKLATRPVKGFKPTMKVSEYFSGMAENTPLRGFGRNNTTKNMIKQIKNSGMTPTEFMDKHGTWDRSMETANKALKGVSAEYTREAFKSGKRTGVSKVVKKFDDVIADLSKDAMESDSAMSELKRVKRARQAFLDKITSEYQNTIKGDNFVMYGERGKASPLEVNIGEVAKSKQRVAQDVPDSYFNATSVQKGTGKGAEKARRLFKDVTDKTTKTTRKLGAEESALISYKKLLDAADTAKKGNKNISFTKYLAPGLGYGTAGPLGAAGGFFLNTFGNSPTGLRLQANAFKALADITKGGGAFSRVSSKASVISKLTKKLASMGIKDPSRVASYMYKYARTERMIR